MAHCTSSALNFFPSHSCNFVEYYYLSSLNLFKECHKNLVFGGFISLLLFLFQMCDTEFKTEKYVIFVCSFHIKKKIHRSK